MYFPTERMSISAAKEVANLTGEGNSIIDLACQNHEYVC